MSRKRVAEEGRNEESSFAIPHGLGLLLTSASSVKLLTDSEQPTVFTSSTAGILAARQSPIDPAQLAIADAHVVVVHDSNSKGRDRTYRLKGEGSEAGERVRILQYAKDGRSLYFTTSLQQTVQTYSVRGGRVSSAGDGKHPQPPSCFAISKNSELIVSASASPTTIIVQNLLLRSRATTIVPQCSNSEVTHAAFHPERPSIFLLAFADGVVGIFDATKTLRDGARNAGKRNPISGEIASVKTRHIASGSAFGKTIACAKFLPGQKAKVVTTGPDGRCHILDFETAEARKEGVIEKIWQQPAPCSSLAVLPYENGRPMLDGADDPRGKSSANMKKSYIIAFARVDGKVTVCDEHGNLLESISINGTGEALLDVEWVKPAPKASSSNPRTAPKVASAQSRKRAAPEPTGDEPLASRRRKGLDTILATKRQETEEASDAESEDAAALPSPLSQTTNLLAPAKKEENYMALFSPIKEPRAQSSAQSGPSQQRKSPRKPKMEPPTVKGRRSSKAFSVPGGARRRSARLSSAAPEDELANAEAGSSVSAPQLWADKPSRKGKERATARAGPSQATRKGKERAVDTTNDSSVLATINRARNVENKQGLRLIASYMPKKQVRGAKTTTHPVRPPVKIASEEPAESREGSVAKREEVRETALLSPVSETREARANIKKNDPADAVDDIWLDIQPSSPPPKAEAIKEDPRHRSPSQTPDLGGESLELSPVPEPLRQAQGARATNARIMEELRILRTEVRELFQEQRASFEEALARERGMMEEIQAENKRLRRELFGR